MVKKIFLILIGIILAVIIIYAGYFAYLYAFYYVAGGAVDGEKITSIAISKNNPSICGKIRTPPFPFFIEGFDIRTQDIIYMCYWETAVALEDEKICDLLETSNIKGHDAIVYRGKCISKVAAASTRKDFSVCNSIVTEFEKGECYSHFTEKGADLSICENVKIPNQFGAFPGRDLCYLKSAKFNLDLTICDTKIVSEQYKNLCYYHIAINTKNDSVCQKISGKYSDFTRDECIEKASS